MSSVEICFTVLFQEVEEGWTQASLQELPAVITAAPTRQEAKELLLDALREYVLALQSDNHPDKRTRCDDREQVKLLLTA